MLFKFDVVMKKIFIIYNIIFLFFGNGLLSQINHHHHHHHHNDHTVEFHECDECLSINNDENFIDYPKNTFLKENINQYVLPVFNTISFNSKRKYQSRAPPIS
tara:strand:- start:29224 stop:29532 length:309 start_codon:yes stop_codon:yes gene_type:complete